MKYDINDPNWGLKAINDQINWALNLPKDPEFNELTTHIETVRDAETSQGIINLIRARFFNPDDLAKIAMAVEAMREELGYE